MSAFVFAHFVAYCNMLKNVDASASYHIFSAKKDRYLELLQYGFCLFFHQENNTVVERSLPGVLQSPGGLYLHSEV